MITSRRITRRKELNGWNRELIIVLNTPTKTDRVILSYWWDHSAEGPSRFIEKRGANPGFKMEKWEAAQTHIAIAPNAICRAAWKEAWREVRLQSKKARMTGYRLLDCAVHMDGEPLPLP